MWVEAVGRHPRRRLTIVPSANSAPIVHLRVPQRHLEPTMSVATQSQPGAPAGIKSYYQAKIEAAEIEINQKTQNLRRLEAQRNALNARGAKTKSHILNALR